MKTPAIIYWGMLAALMSGCRTCERHSQSHFTPPPTAEAEAWWNWYWQVIEAERRDSKTDSSRSSMPIMPPKLQKLTRKEIKGLCGRWECDLRWNASDDENTAMIEFSPDGSFRVEWRDGAESGSWIVRANRIELYKLENQQEPEFRFFVISESNAWFLVNADAERGMSRLSKIRHPS